MLNLILMMLRFLFGLFRTQALMQAEIIALRHQVIVLQRAQKIFSYLRTTTVVIAVFCIRSWRIFWMTMHTATFPLSISCTNPSERRHIWMS
jgi:hypothetical protein